MAFMKNKKQSNEKMFDKEEKEKHDKWIIEDKDRTITARSTGQDNNCQRGRGQGQDNHGQDISTKVNDGQRNSKWY
jgi:hypothetical protein